MHTCTHAHTIPALQDHFTASVELCGSCVYSHALYTYMIYVCSVCFALSCCCFSPKKKNVHISNPQEHCLYNKLQYMKQDRSIGSEKRVVPIIAMLLQHHEPRGFAGCQAVVTYRAVCLFSLPSFLTIWSARVTGTLCITDLSLCVRECVYMCVCVCIACLRNEPNLLTSVCGFGSGVH